MFWSLGVAMGFINEYLFIYGTNLACRGEVVSSAVIGFYDQRVHVLQSLRPAKFFPDLKEVQSAMAVQNDIREY